MRAALLPLPWAYGIAHASFQLSHRVKGVWEKMYNESRGTSLWCCFGCEARICLSWSKHGKPKTGNQRYSKEVLKQGSKGKFREREGPELQSGLDSINLSGLWKTLRGPLTGGGVVMTSALTVLHLFFGEVSIPGDPLVAALTQKETHQPLHHIITHHFLKGFGFSLEGSCSCTGPARNRLGINN